LGLASACAPRPLVLPSGPGAPFDDAAAAYAEATRACAGVRTFTAELALSGKAGRTKLRGRVLAGLERPDGVRLEGVAPFGAPAFIFVARGGRATLLLPRDNRVLRDAEPAAVVEALIGVPLDPEALAAALTGCGTLAAEVRSGRRYGDDQAMIDLASNTSVFLRLQAGRWRVVVAIAGTYTVEYPESSGDRPARVRLRTKEGAPVAADLSVVPSQVDINTDLDPAAFEVEVPPDAAPITLDELRDAGPLGQQGVTTPASAGSGAEPRSRL
jgi:hypothetical protein